MNQDVHYMAGNGGISRKHANMDTGVQILVMVIIIV